MDSWKRILSVLITAIMLLPACLGMAEEVGVQPAEEAIASEELAEVAAQEVALGDPEVEASDAVIDEPVEEAPSIAEEVEVMEFSEEMVEPGFEAAEEAVFVGEIEDETVQGDVALMAVTGDTVLSTGTTTTLNIPTGINGKCYASYTMTEAGMLTIEFKSAAGNIAHGNVKITIKSEEDLVLWTKMWATSIGTTSFSGFVEAGDYSITIEKSDITDDAAYEITALPTVKWTGEQGVKNNTQNNAASINVGSTAYGIFTLQDVAWRHNDFYSFTLSQPGRVTIKFTNLSMEDIDVYLYGDDTSTENMITTMSLTMPKVDNRDEMNATTVSRDGWLDAGIYYVVAFTRNTSVDGRYKIEISEDAITLTEKERNNTFSKAYAVGNFLTLDGYPLDCLLSESNGEDCFVFQLTKPTLCNFSIKLQFPGIAAGIFDRDGNFISGSAFGDIGLDASEGNPKEIELRKLLLDAGYYFAYTGWDVSNHTGKYSISATTSITASELKATVNPNGESANITASMSGYDGASTSWLYFYQEIDGKPVLLETYTFVNETSIAMVYTPITSGDYLVQYVVSDGVNWHDKWESFSVVVPEFKIVSIKTEADENGTIKCKAEYTGNAPLKASEAALYLNNVMIDVQTLKGASEWTFQAPVTGNYSIQYSATMNGAQWKDGWTTCSVTVPETQLPLLVDTLTVNSNDTGNITCTAKTAQGTDLKSVLFVLYKNNKEQARVSSKNTLSASFKVATSGTYLVQCVAYDGITYADKWASTTVNLASSAPLTVTSLSAVADKKGSGVISLSATSQYGGKLNYSKFAVYRNGQMIYLVDANNGNANVTVYYPGDYLVQYVVSDGTTWADRWTTVTVTLDDAHKPLQITSVNAVADLSGAISINCTYTTGRPVQKLEYYIYNSADEIVNVDRTQDSTSSKLYVTKSGNYNIQVVGFDGVIWADGWTSIAVTVPSSTSTTLTVTGLTATISGVDSVTLNSTTNDSRALTYSKFWIYKNNVAILSVDTPLKHSVVSGLEAGPYTVQYVACDGTTWADRWGSFTIGETNLKVDSLAITSSTVVNGIQYTCDATITNNLKVQAALYALYDSSDNIIAKWEWDGTGDYLSHVFVMDPSQTVAKVQYVVYDGVKWVDRWTTP
mgnify:CR=1 FL=1